MAIRRWFLLPLAMAWALSFSWGWAVAQSPAALAAHGVTVAVDPGHGGKDVGAKGSMGTTENQICLTLAQRLTQMLELSYRVVLTRGDDFEISQSERSAIANNQKADMLISIHTGAGFVHAAGGVVIYYYQPTAKSAGPSGSTLSGEGLTPWQDLQLSHRADSQRLARHLKTAFEAVAGMPDVRLVSAPLLVLQGADMPAVVIEVGSLSNPAEEERLNNPLQQENLAQAIMKGLEGYLAEGH